MRILKRNLAFVLAMVMALSLTVSAMGVEDYSDKNDIAFVEAVDVLTEMGVLEGTDGVFNPTNTLTREEGAKIIAYLMLGKTAADNLNVGEAPFADVPANRWSAGYVAYCASQGIVKGVSATEFNPKGELTGTAFATMLLRAVGYGVNGEFEGAKWESEVNALALKLGVFDGNLGVNFSAACTREEAALYAFNTLMDVYTVNYSELFGTYYAGSTVLDQETENYMTLNDELYGYDTKTSTDAFGRKGYVWVNAKNKTVTGTYGVEADLTYTAAVKLVDIYADLGLEEEVAAKHIMNGVAQNNTLALNDKETNKKSIGDNGVLIEVFANEVKEGDEYVTKVEIVEIYTYLAEVDADAEDGEVDITLLSPTSMKKDYTYETAVEYEEGDLVLVTIAKGAVKSMELAEGITGELTGRRTDKYVKLDGEQYDFSAKAVATNLNTVKLDECVLYVDAYGYAMYAGEVEEADEEIVLDGYVKINKKAVERDTFGDVEGVVAKVTYFADGTKETVNLALNEDGDKFLMVGTDDKEYEMAVDTVLSPAYGYYMNENDEMVLVVLKDAVYNAAMSIEFNGEREDKSETYRLNTKTVATVVNDDDVDVYEGYADIDFKVVEEEVLMILNGEIIKEIYVLGEKNATAADEDVIVYFDGDSYEENTDGTYDIVVYTTAGKTADYTIEKLIEAGVYAIDVNTDNEITKTVKKDTLTVAAVEDEYFTVGAGEDAKNYYYAEDVVIHDVTDGIDADLDIADIEANDVVVIVADKDDKAVTVVFIVG